MEVKRNWVKLLSKRSWYGIESLTELSSVLNDKSFCE